MSRKTKNREILINIPLYDVDMKIKIIKVKITNIITGSKLGEETITE